MLNKLLINVDSINDIIRADSLNGVRIIVVLTFIAFMFFCTYLFKNSRKHRIKILTKRNEAITPQEFFKIRKRGTGKRRTSTFDNEFDGVYIIYNITKDMYYVGQSKHVMARVNSHLTGHGNGDVYADYKYGDEFEITLIPLKESGYSSLNAMEKDTIDMYDAYTKGYNRTRGNE